MLTEFILSTLGRPRSNKSVTLSRQLHSALMRALQNGLLNAGERLPSSREMANDLGLSRNTVMAALEQLEVEGYLFTLVGSGTFVIDDLPRFKSKRTQEHKALGKRNSISARGQQMLGPHSAKSLEVQPFTEGFPDFSPFPLQVWQKLLNKHWRMSYPEMLDYSPSAGFAPLRRAIAQYLRMFRGVELDSAQVIVTTGTQQSLALCATLLADHGDTAWVEDPLYWGASKVLKAAGLSLQGIAVDDQGINIKAAPAGSAPKLIYVTPSHQYPMGRVMSLPRRHQLLEQARLHGAWILEDDYDSEFRFSGAPLSSLQGLDREGCVLYMGTFSKALYPGIKLGYLVVPTPLADAFLQGHYDLNRPGQIHQQAAMAEFIELGHFHTSLRRTKNHYEIRRQALLESLQACLGADALISGAEQGLHLCLHLPQDVDDVALAQQASLHGLTVRPLSIYAVQRKDLSGLVIGYGYAPLKQIESGGVMLSKLVRTALNARLTHSNRL